MSRDDTLPRVVMTLYTDSIRCVEEVIGSTDEPVYVLTSGCWVKSMCREATAEEEIQYWMERAKNAEAKHAEA